VAVALAAVCWPAVRLALPWQLLTLLAATSVYLAVCLGIGAVTLGEARRLARLLRRSRQAPPAEIQPQAELAGDADRQHRADRDAAAQVEAGR